MTTPVDDVDLARGVLSETLHGPVPLYTVARLAKAVIRLDAERQWRPLTSDPATWPEEGRLVVLRADFAPIGDDLERIPGPTEYRYCTGPWSRPCAEFWSWWLPLPPPPKGESK